MKTETIDFLLVFLIIIALILIIILIAIGVIADDIKYIRQDLEDIVEYQDNRSDKIIKSRDELQSQNKHLSEELSFLKNENEDLRQIILDSVEKDIETKEISDVLNKDRLPDGVATNMFRCEDFRRLNIESSDQYKLQQECITDLKTGIRCYTTTNDVYYCAALAGAYGTMIGDAWMVTLKNGYTFNVIMGDFKHPIDNVSTDDFGDKDQNYNGEDCINIIEFICDLKIAPKSVINAGTMSALEEFGGLYTDGGNIMSMRYLGRKWEP